MAKYSDWRDDLREVMDDEVDDKKVKEKKVNNAKLIKINPKLGEAVEELGGHIVEVSELEDKQSDKEFEDDADVKKAEQNKKKEDQLKKRIIRMKLRGLNQGSGDTLVAHNEPEGELVEASPALAANTKIKNKDDRKKKEKEYARLISILAHQKDLKKRGLGEEALDERLGGKGYKSYTSLTGKKVSGDWEDSDRGAGNKAKKRAGGKVEKKSPTYKAHVLNKEEVVSEGDVHSGQGEKIQKRTKAWMDKKGQKGAPGLDAMKARTAEHKAKRGVKEEVVDEGVMKFIKDKVGSKKKPEKKPEMDKTTDKLHNLRKDKFKTDRQKEHEKFVNFLDVDEEFVTELNRYGKETGKATGSLNKRPGKPVGKKNEPNSPVNTVRRMIRRDTGRPEGQQKKVKGSPRGQQPGDRKLTPAQTISRMRAQVAAADAAMRDTRGT